jgi:hypothetical protein
VFAPVSLTEDALTLLRFTDTLDDENVTSLWIGLSTASSPETRLHAVGRWLSWAQPATVPFDDNARFSAAATSVIDTLFALATQTEHSTTAPPDVIQALARALRAWTSVRDDTQVHELVGGVRASIEAIAQGASAPSVEQRNVLAHALRKYLARAPAHASSEALHALTSLDPVAPVLAPFAESLLDLLLLDADLRGSFDIALAECASMPWWPNALRLGFDSIGRGAVRAARLLFAVATNPSIVEELPPASKQTIVDIFPKAFAHPRYAVWSRAARAAGRLAGVLPGINEMLEGMLEPSASLAVRRRAHAALATVSLLASESLLQKREQFDQLQTEPWQLAALAIGLPDVCDGTGDKWIEMVRALAARGGPETWAQLSVSLREIASRSSNLAHTCGGLADELRGCAEHFQANSPAEAEANDRAHALVGRVGDDDGELTPGALLVAAARRAADAPEDPSIAGAVEEFIAHTENAVSSALKAVGVDHQRAALRAGVVLDEVLDLVVDGDMLVVAERIADPNARAAALQYAEALRARLLRTTWTGLRRPTPNTATWRRWLLRAAAVLPRVDVQDTAPQDHEKVLRSLVFETLERVADDPSVRSPSLQRYVVATIVELSNVLRLRFGPHAVLAVLCWMAIRGGELPLHNRVRRSLEGVSAEAIDTLYFTVEKLAKNKRADSKDLLELAEITTDRCRLGSLLRELATHSVELDGRKPEMHWSGLPRMDLLPIAKLGDRLSRVREHAIEGLTSDESIANSPSAEPLEERAAKLNRSLTSISLKFVDAARRAEIVEQYVLDLASLSESIATACGPVIGPLVRATLARALIAVRAQAATIAAARDESVRFIGRLRVLGPLGAAAEGGMASTWLAEGPAPGKRVVVKLLHWDRYSGIDADSARKLFEGEMSRLAEVVHPNVVSLVDAGFVDEGAYIAVELIPGASLETILRTVGAIDLRFLGLILRDAARGLAHLHARGIVHRDIKPGNILVQLDGLEGDLNEQSLANSVFIRAVVIDLGISTEVSTATPDELAQDTLIGTPGYLAPEIARGLNTISPALDVYALAVVAYEALTNSNPYLEDCDELTTVLVRHGTMHLPTEQLPQSALDKPAFVQLLRDASALDPKLRPSMRDFLQRLGGALK